MIPIIVLVVVFLLIAFRQIGSIRLPIWMIMLGGALLVLVTGQISFDSALRSINTDIILFLFGMFIVGVALEDGGYLSSLANLLFRKAPSIDVLLLFILFGMAIASMLLMNDTVAIIGTPLMLLLAKRHHLHTKLLLLALAFAITIGSVMSPIGNPQNLLIAIHGNLDQPFIAFFTYLFLPTMINLLLCYLLLKWFYRKHFHTRLLIHEEVPITNPRLAFLSQISLLLIIILIVLKIIFIMAIPSFDFDLLYIALIGALPLLLFSQERLSLLKKVDWQTLIFFASLFVLMQSVWDSGFFQQFLFEPTINLTSIPMIFTTSIFLSQFISNVPLVALYLPMLQHAGASAIAFIALAAGSTIAGNLFILGAASNIIIIQNAEKRTGETISFFEFAAIGIPLTLLNALVYIIFLI
ncbi:anion transporter [Candidatus Woesearchaeota archaeon]|nr:anion transporter [Candidatus Woesearchaeota archaeon]